MNGLRSAAASRYLAWAKRHSNARFNLASSGVLDYPLAELPVRIEDIEFGGTGPYGYPPLMQRLAAKAGVPEESVVYTFGTSMANFIALTALIQPGDEVLVERPTYEPLLTILEHIGARVLRFERLSEKGFRLGLGEVERKLTPKTRLVILCNLHNPSSSFTDDNGMRQVGEMAAKVGARVLVRARGVPLHRGVGEWWRGVAPRHVLTLWARDGGAGAWTIWLLLHPALGHDMTLYHLPEAVQWVHGGRPGAVERVIVSVPVGSYPLTHEVLLEWGLALARSFVWATLVTALMPVLLAAALWTGLRALGVGIAVAALAPAALVATPAVIASQSGGASLDPAALGWLATCAALCPGALRRPALLTPAVLAAALALGTKTTAAPLALGLLAATAIALRADLRPIVGALASTALLAVVVGGVWYIRNTLWHGWPLWPFSAAPWGDPRPAIIANADVHFIARPAATLHRLAGYYWQHFGGPLLLLGGALLAPLAARSRVVLVATLVTVASVVLWMNAPFTGVLATHAFDIGTGDSTRYLLPGASAAVVAVALASQRSGAVRAATVTLLAVATVIGLHETFALGFPSAPAPGTPVAGAAAGALAAAVGLAWRLRRIRATVLARGARNGPPARAVLGGALGGLTLAATAIAGAAAADGYVARHGATQTRESRVAGWLASQPFWRTGHSPVASTWSLIGPLAGDRLQHPLVLVQARSACPAERGDWLVIDVHEQQAAHASSCGRPAYADTDFEAYAPAQPQPLARVAAP